MILPIKGMIFRKKNGGDKESIHARINLFSRKKYQSLIFVWKISFKYLIYKIIIKMRLLGF